MPFSSNLFLFLFLPSAIFLYFLIDKHRWRNSVLVFMSTLFYAWGAPRFLLFFLATILLDYLFVVLMVRKASNPLQRKAILVFAVTVNLGFLFYFKYANFMVHECTRLLTSLGFKGPVWTDVMLPLGISFFTFHKISYVVDIYRNRGKIFSNIQDYYLYLMFFPQLIAGPIIRFNEIADQIKFRRHSAELFFEGIWRFSLGLGKKVLIADVIGKIVTKCFDSDPGRLDTPMAWLGIVGYTFQIFFDFSGYTDMAVGMGRMFGFVLPENFNRPYLARNMTDFWRRWHMSLTNFFRDYVYIPLGGNRTPGFRQYLNLWTVFLLCGLWHGANWTFLVWGAYHGIILTSERLFLTNFQKYMPGILNNIFTLLLISCGWVIFRSPDLGYAAHYFKAMFSWHANGSLAFNAGINTFNSLAIVAAAVASFYPQMGAIIPLGYSRSLKGVFALFLLTCSIATMSDATFSPFIYFQF